MALMADGASTRAIYHRAGDRKLSESVHERSGWNHRAGKRDLGLAPARHVCRIPLAAAAPNDPHCCFPFPVLPASVGKNAHGLSLRRAPAAAVFTPAVTFTFRAARLSTRLRTAKSSVDRIHSTARPSRWRSIMAHSSPATGKFKAARTCTPATSCGPDRRLHWLVTWWAFRCRATCFTSSYTIRVAPDH